jgi:hypothetical protein
MYTTTTVIHTLPVSNWYSQYQDPATGKLFFKKILYLVFWARGGFTVGLQPIEEGSFPLGTVNLTERKHKSFVRYVQLTKLQLFTNRLKAFCYSLIH